MTEPKDTRPTSGPPERATLIDWVMIGLAGLSLGLVVVEQSFPSYFDSRPHLYRWFYYVDLGICAVFAVEFVERLMRAPRKWEFAKSRWYDVLGMIPVSHPMLRGLRLFRIVRVIVIGSRFVRTTNRTFGEMAFEATLRRFQGIFVEIISDAVLVRSLRTLEPVFATARLAESVGDAIDGRRSDIVRLVRDRFDANLVGSVVLRFGRGRKLVEGIQSAAVDATIETLRSDELNHIIQDSMMAILAELKHRVVSEYQAPELE